MFHLLDSKNERQYTLILKGKEFTDMDKQRRVRDQLQKLCFSDNNCSERAVFVLLYKMQKYLGRGDTPLFL